MAAVISALLRTVPSLVAAQEAEPAATEALCALSVHPASVIVFLEARLERQATARAAASKGGPKNLERTSVKACALWLPSVGDRRGMVPSSLRFPRVL